MSAYLLRNALVGTAIVLLAQSASSFGETLNDKSMVVFGDSLSDTGNDFLATGGVIPGPNYANGRFTDGPSTTPGSPSPQGIWVDQLAPKLGLTSPSPTLAGGTNFAFGGSETGANEPAASIPPSVNAQVALALTDPKLGNPSSALYTFWAGANDIFDHPGNLAAPVKAADDIFNQILALSAAGGKDFLWFNLPPLGLTPEGASLGKTAAAAANYETSLFDSEMQIDVEKLNALGVNIIPVDVESLYLSFLRDFEQGCTVGSADPLCFANISTPAQGLAVDPNTYLFWDKFHPTTEGHALIADAAYDAIFSAPEPASLALAAAGLIALGILKKRKNRS